MAVHVSISVFGDQQLERRLERFADRPRNLAGAYEVLKRKFFEYETEQFESQGATGSGGWPALKDSTIRSKAAHGQVGGILEATGRLFRSLSSDGEDWAGYYNRREMFFGTNVAYAKFHQRGTRRMPRRRPVELNAAQRREFVKTFQTWLVMDDRRQSSARSSMWADA